MEKLNNEPRSKFEELAWSVSRHTNISLASFKTQGLGFGCSITFCLEENNILWKTAKLNKC